jgi:hypothetical protein
MRGGEGEDGRQGRRSHTGIGGGDEAWNDGSALEVLPEQSGRDAGDGIDCDPPSPRALWRTSGEVESISDSDEGEKIFAELVARLKATGRWHPAWRERGIEAFWRALAALPPNNDNQNSDGGRGKDNDNDNDYDNDNDNDYDYDYDYEIDNIGGTLPSRAGTTPAEWFAAFLESLPPIVPLGELAAPVNAPRLLAKWGHGLPNGGAIDADSLELHRAVVAWMDERPGVNYAEALRACARGMR